MTIDQDVLSHTNGERKLCIDRLTRIDGIARKTAEAVYEIGIHSYADLAQYSSQHTAEQISAALKEHGVRRPSTFIDPEMWARQARAFGELENAAPTLADEARMQTAKHNEAPSGRDSREHDAEFAVFFDVAVADEDQVPVVHTTVTDRTNGAQEQVFQGNDVEPWVNWMLERANLPADVERITAQADASCLPLPKELGDARIAIRDVQVSVLQPAADREKKLLQAEVSFCLSGSDAETLALKRITYRIEGYTVDLESGVSELVTSEQSQLEPEVFEYVGQQEFGVPNLGHYEFYSIVLLLPPGTRATYHCGPTIEVVP
jgi:hypothetical protein